MKKLNVFLAGIAAIGLVACGNDEPNGNINVEPNNPTGDVAYLAVNIQDANAARSTTDGGFAYGTAEDESKVNNAHFYFFDETGAYTELEAEIWREGGMNTANPDANIEHFGKNVIVLKGLKSVGYPKYMLTVINAPVNYHPEATLEATAKALTSWGATANFMMTTTSYYGGSDVNHTDAYYYANVLQPDNFLPQTPGTDPVAPNEPAANYVNVYVERLAVKVQVTLDKDLEGKKLEDGTMIYALPVTVAGGDNIDQPDFDPNIAETKLYAKFSNWGLNVTAKNSYVSKNLDEWDATTKFAAWGNTANWNVPQFFRSYWGKSVDYGTDINTNTHNFITYNDLTVPFAMGENADKAAYCNEYTNTPDKINTTVTEYVDGVSTQTPRVDPSKVTSVLLQAELCDETGEPLTMVLHNGVLFFEESYIAYVINLAGPFYTRSVDAENDNTVVYTKYTSTTGLSCTHDDATYTEVVCDPTELTGVELYKLKATATTAGSDDDFEAVSLADFANAITAAQEKLTASLYNKGAMFYNIPIEHQALNGNNIDMEGYYGVVRNHWYKLNITKIHRIGIAVNDPDQIIIPKPETPEYYLGADINILSWKVVNQDVPLN